MAAGDSVLLDRVAAVLETRLQLPRNRGLAWQLLEYKAGEAYKPHLDCDYALRKGAGPSNARLLPECCWLMCLSAA